MLQIAANLSSFALLGKIYNNCLFFRFCGFGFFGEQFVYCGLIVDVLFAAKMTAHFHFAQFADYCVFFLFADAFYNAINFAFAAVALVLHAGFLGKG